MKTKFNSKKIILCIMVCMALCETVSAQINDMQIHKELGSFKINDSTKVKRDGFRAKFEKLGKDSLGTYYWTTSVLYSKEDKSVSANLQIMHGIRFAKSTKIEAMLGHQSAIGTTNQWFAGVHYPVIIGKVKLLPFIAYVYKKDQQSADFRFTTGYATNLAKNKILIFGFANLYTKDLKVGDNQYEKEFAFQANPQVWFRFSRQIALGTEVSIDYLKSRYQNCIIVPTAAFRWAF